MQPLRKIYQRIVGGSSGSTDVSLLSFLPEDSASQDLNRLWDREWIVYLRTENPYYHLQGYEDLRVTASPAGKSAEDVYKTCLTEDTVTLEVWVPGDNLVNKRIGEIGCGCGVLGKRMGLICRQYLGVDRSEFALHVARLTSPANCHYLHVSDKTRIAELIGSIDTMVSRNFFIHQNLENATWVLKLAAALLKQGGIVTADFFRETTGVPTGVVHSAQDNVDLNNLSCGFTYSVQAIEKLAQQTGFHVRSIDDRPDYQRRFCILERR